MEQASHSFHYQRQNECGIGHLKTTTTLQRKVPSLQQSFSRNVGILNI